MRILGRGGGSGLRWMGTTGRMLEGGVEIRSLKDCLDGNSEGAAEADCWKETDMATKVKTLDNMTKHLSKAEIDVRETAEVETLPTRARVTLTAPAYLRKDELAIKYWRLTCRRLKVDGLALLDDLDTEVLATYCSALSRRDRLNILCNKLLTMATDDSKLPADQLKATDELDSLVGKIGSLERTLLTYADKLGLTPASRAALSRRRSAFDAAEAQADDLFGD